jgi:hypothetical protein
MNDQIPVLYPDEETDATYRYNDSGVTKRYAEFTKPSMVVKEYRSNDFCVVSERGVLVARRVA